MYTETVTVDGADVYVHHNSDWSGDAIIVWMDAAGRHEVKLPGKTLLKIAERAVTEQISRRLIRFAEDL